MADEIFRKSIQILKRYDHNNLVRNHREMSEIQQNSRLKGSKMENYRNSDALSPIKRYLGVDASSRSLLMNQSMISVSDRNEGLTHGRSFYRESGKSSSKDKEKDKDRNRL